MSSDTRQNKHTYTIDWKPDYITWSIDGEPMRTKYRNETYNSTTQSYHFPQSPSRVQISLWPGGLESNGEGTINWAGGVVDWNSQYMTNGYYYAMVYDVSVECYDPPDGFNMDYGSDAYYYTSDFGTNDTVAIGNNETTLASFYATGNNPKKDPNASKSASASSATSSSTASASSQPEMVPGMSGGGNQGIAGGAGSSESSGQGSSGTDSSAASQSSSAGGSTMFEQGGSSSGSGDANTSQAPKMVAGSVVALVGFFVACLLL